MDVNSHHVPDKPVLPVDLAAPGSIPSDAQSPQTPVHNARPVIWGTPASTPKLSTEDDVEQDVDEIERIGEHRDDDGVAHAAKLTHPDDDDSITSDEDLPAFHNDGQVRMGDAKDKNMEVDDLLNADHPSKDPSDLAKEEQDDDKVPDQLQKPKAEQRPIETLKEQTPWSEHYDFPTWDECQELKTKADVLPDLVHVPFEVSVKDVVLEGWEDQWIAKARYLGPKLAEPKIDFVYNCESSLPEDAS
jgi:hypothetical protein